MRTRQPAWPEATQDTATEAPDLDGAIRNYVLAYAPWPGRPQAARRLGVSRHTLRRCPERGHPGHSLLGMVTKAVVYAPDTMAAAARAMTASRQIR